MCHTRHKHITIMSVYHFGLLCLCFIVNHWAPGSNSWPCGYYDENCALEGAFAPNSADCAKFYLCNNGRWRLSNCSRASNGICGTPVEYCRRLTCPQNTSISTLTSLVTSSTMKIIPTSVPSSQKPITTSHTDITTSGTSMGPTSATTPGRASNQRIISDTIPWSNTDNTLGVVAGVLTSVALAALLVVQCVIFVMVKRRQDSSERSVQSNPRVAQEQRRTADLASSEQRMVNTGASGSHANNYMFLVKSEYIDGSAMSEDNGGRPEYQELVATEVPWTPFEDEYSYAYYTAADEVNPEGGSEEEDTKQNSDACEMQHVYSIDVHNT